LTSAGCEIKVKQTPLDQEAKLQIEKLGRKKREKYTEGLFLKTKSKNKKLQRCF